MCGVARRRTVAAPTRAGDASGGAAADDDAMEIAREIDGKIEAMKDKATEEINAMIDSDASVAAEIARVKASAARVAEGEIDKVERAEKAKVERAFEEMTAKTGEVQSKAEAAALEAAALKADAVAAAEAKMAALASERAALEAELAKEDAKGAKWATPIDEDAEKVESGKAAALSGVGGAALATPLILSQGGGAISIAIAAASCAVFGVTYRYAVRRDIGNDELKGGVVGAFGLARGLSAADVYLRAAALSGESDFTAYAQAALLTGEGVLMYAFAAIALEQGFQRGFLKPFGEAGEQ